MQIYQLLLAIVMGLWDFLSCSSLKWSAFLDHKNNFKYKAVCLHQAPSRKRVTNPELADLAIAPFFAKSWYPARYLAVWDIKEDANKFDVAERQTSLYQYNNLAVPEDYERNEWPVAIGMPGTKSIIELQVFVPAAKSMLWRTAICKCAPWNKALLATFYVATHYLLQFPV